MYTHGLKGFFQGILDNGTGNRAGDLLHHLAAFEDDEGGNGPDTVFGGSFGIFINR